MNWTILMNIDIYDNIDHDVLTDDEFNKCYNLPENGKVVVFKGYNKHIEFVNNFSINEFKTNSSIYAKFESWSYIDDILELFQYPFNCILINNGSIDYKSTKDQEYVKSLGYKIKMHSDCSFSCELNAISLAGYGNWGSFYTNSMDEESFNVIIDMVTKGIITLWRGNLHINKVWYKYEDKQWIRYNEENNKWDKCDDPIKNNLI